jgi:hypothetical protein
MTSKLHKVAQVATASGTIPQSLQRKMLPSYHNRFFLTIGILSLSREVDQPAHTWLVRPESYKAFTVCRRLAPQFSMSLVYDL